MTFDKLLFVSFSFLAITLLTSSQAISYVFGLPQAPEFKDSNECWTSPTPGKPGEYQTTCCWTVVDAEGIELDYCQTCQNYSGFGHANCGPVYPASKVTADTGRLPPGGLDNTPTLEQQPTENVPPPKSDESIVPNDDSKVLDESQPINPTFNSNKGSIINENLAEDQPMQFSSNDEQSQESDESTETNDAETESNTQEIDDSSNSETTTSLSKRGNTQNSPVPPECPKQGPIPPDCTMKPKF